MFAVLHRRKLAVGVVGTLLVGLLLSVAIALSSCSQTPTEVPVRTFERAQRMDVACLRLYDQPAPNAPPTDPHTPREPIGRPESECAPIPPDVDGEFFDKQLFALVTQTTRGELAVVDISAGRLVDQSRAIPGINFIPVGALPTDVAVTPDGKMAFVAAAETNKPAIYGIPTRRLLGDTAGFPRDPAPLTLASWPVCALPQSPGAITVVPRKAEATSAPDAGTDAGDAGAGSGELPALYDIVVVLPGDRQNTAKVLTLDPRPFRRGGLPLLPNGQPDYASDVSDGDAQTLNAGPILAPGQLQPCAILQESAIELVGAAGVPSSFVPGPEWNDGVVYVDGGVDLTCKLPAPASGCGLAPCCNGNLPTTDAGSPADAGTTDGGTSTDGGSCEPAGAKDAGTLPLNVGAVGPPAVAALARDGQMLYLADQSAPLIHAIDMSNPAAPRELSPFVATSLPDTVAGKQPCLTATDCGGAGFVCDQGRCAKSPSRAVKLKQLAVSPATRDFKRFLYAVDETAGSLIVYDVTDPATAKRTPLTRAHPELNPFQPSDRIGFSSPVVAVEFARHDVPLAQINGVQVASVATGLLCNPNPKLERVNGGDPLSDLGFFYRPDSTDTQPTAHGQAIGPTRLRGIFAFATLASGQVIAINVDDWDSPCRRPLDMSVDVSDLAVAEPNGGPTDTNPYHAPGGALGSPSGPPLTVGAVTNEAFFPMSAPHSLRSNVLITNDAVNGNQIPRLVSLPTLTSINAQNQVSLPLVGQGSENSPMLDVRFAFEEPQAHIDQDWSIIFEPPIPGFDGVTATIRTTDAYSSLVFDQPAAHFCTKGVEDWSRGIVRTNTINAELAKSGTSLPAGTDRFMADYIQLNDDLLDVTDDYWSLDQSQGDQSCWEGALATASGAVRHDVCDRTYGSFASDQKPTRDFPIVEAFDDHVVVGRFFTPATPPNVHRQVVYTDPSNASDLKLMQCCFHHQAKFHVRTGELWGAVGTTVGAATGTVGLGFFSHLTTDSNGRCVTSCNPALSLLNARLPTVPPSIVSANVGKNSPLALRNPMYSAVIIGAASGKEPIRDLVYSFSTRGQFQALAVNITGGSTDVSPQSMRFVNSLGQIAVVDGASQGLVLIDLDTVTVARAPFF